MMSITVYVIPDYQNGSRVLIIVTDVDILTLFELENGEKIALDLLPSGGPLIRIKCRKLLVFYPILWKQVIRNT